MRKFAWLVVILPFLTSGCGLLPRSPLTGYIYQRYKVPFTEDLRNTPVSWKVGGGKIVEIEEPFSGYGVSAEFNTNAVGDIALQHGMTRVYWADIEYVNVLGIWKEKRLYLYGE